MLAPSQYGSLLRQELCARNASYAALHKFPHVTSYGEPPVIVYQPSVCGRRHGNFISPSYRAIMRRPEWRRRLQKVHSQAKHALPGVEYVWRELDSSMSSDALLMNIFCYPGVTKRREVSLLLGTDMGDIPEFGFRPHVPLFSGGKERTEVDMKLGGVLFEAKLTEGIPRFKVPVRLNNIATSAKYLIVPTCREEAAIMSHISCCEMYSLHMR
jgi:hypothetical protein